MGPRSVITRLHEWLFGDASLLRQAYAWFFASVIGVGTSLFLSTRVLIICTNVLSWLAITISAQTFIAAAKANRRLGDD
jgi:hypothetical protein